MNAQAQRMAAVTLLPHGKECSGRGMHCIVAAFVAPHRQSACACLSGLASTGEPRFNASAPWEHGGGGGGLLRHSNKKRKHSHAGLCACAAVKVPLNEAGGPAVYVRKVAGRKDGSGGAGVASRLCLWHVAGMWRGSKHLCNLHPF